MMKPDSVVSIAAALRTRINGAVYEPADAAYATEASAFNTSVVHKPHVVVAVTSANDVVEVVRVARGSRVKINVQATGHGAIAPIDRRRRFQPPARYF